jgi:hypothetical protein
VDEDLKPADSEERRGCEQAPALDAGGHCNALNQHADSVQKMIIIARLFTLLAKDGGAIHVSRPGQPHVDSELTEVTTLSAPARYRARIDPQLPCRIRCSSYCTRRPFAPHGKSDCQNDGPYENSDEPDRGNASDDPKHDDDEGHVGGVAD